MKKALFILSLLVLLRAGCDDEVDEDDDSSSCSGSDL